MTSRLLLFSCLALLALRVQAEPETFRDGPVSRGDITVIRHGCSSAPVHRLIGKRLTPDTYDELLSRSGANSLKVVRQGSGRDLSYSANRLIVEVDGQRRIAELSCD